jgi:hypothetical protein
MSNKTKEIVDLREHHPIHIDGATVEEVEASSSAAYTSLTN